MFGREVKLQAIEDSTRLLRREAFVHGRWPVRREIVDDDADLLRVGIVLVDEVAQAVGEVQARSTVGNFGVSPGSVRVDEHEDVGGQGIQAAGLGASLAEIG